VTIEIAKRKPEPAAKLLRKAESPKTFRVMTLNIWNYNGPWERRRALIVDLIRRARPDAVGLQEVRYDEQFNESDLNQAQQLAERLEMDCVFQPAMTYSRDPLVWEGLAVLTHHRIASTSYVWLSRDEGDPRDLHQRIALRALLRGTFGEVDLYNTHWSLSPRARLRNAEESRRFVLKGAGRRPQVLVGDLNDGPDSAPLKALCRRRGKAAHYLADVWSEVCGGLQGFTCANPEPQARIDYVLCVCHPQRRGLVPLGIERVGDKCDATGLFPSDHCGLVAEFALP